MEEDRINQLPDEILVHILSFIDSYEAFETTFLSKRWKNLWRSLPSLRLHLSSAASSDFVSHFLSHRDATAPVHSLNLSLDDKFNLKLVNKCVLYAINHGVQSLRLRAYNTHLRLPAALFTSTTLCELELKLFNNNVTRAPGRLLLPNLKTLFLEAHSTFDDDTGMETFAGLPGLEKLTLRGRPFTSLVLKAPKLRVLEILQYSRSMEEISAPLLTSFRFEGFSPLECSMMNLPMLEQVYVDIYNIGYNVKKLHRMLHQLGNATNVSLTLDTLKVLELDDGPIEQSPPPFPNLKCLKVMKGHYKIRTVLQSVMNYLTIGTLYFEKVEFPDGVTVVEKNM
ncbi:putative F-box/LRR-repeat protein At3g42770 [Salvia hispanica]|uniref:putative F-box/LRR-repeat protein At3g42770 n=1 Tax=Salvia hispanica TaxID=49212 RepID=UPI00200972B4|nr:putative F-box/LRR-repeat protein At3g42770 [Salvia hispanica]